MSRPFWSDSLDGLQRQWQAMSARERLGLRLAALVLGLLLLWLLALAPALRTLQRAPQQLDRLDGQLQQMRALAEQAQALRGQPVPSNEQALKALRAASERLGPAADLSIQGGRAQLRLKGVSGAALNAWLGEARSAARARPLQADLQWGPQGYSGSVLLLLPGQGS